MTSPTGLELQNGQDDFHPTLSNFLDFVEDSEITIQPEIKIQELTGRGFGIVAAEHIEADTDLIWVPTSAILQPSSVPESFIPLAQRLSYGVTEKEEGDGKVRMRTHALLAAWIAFGDCVEYEAWMATWPSLDDMKTGMLICWPEATKSLRRLLSGIRKQTRKGDNGSEAAVHSEEGQGVANQEFAVLPWDITGQRATTSRGKSTPLGKKVKKGNSSSRTSHTSEPSSSGLLTKQQAKFDQDLLAVRTALPHVSDVLDNQSTQLYATYLHAWLIVNSRCFYYIPAGCSAPEDSDEAMALCPAIDLFNHDDSDSGGCSVTHDDDGFTVKVSEQKKQGYEAGEELFFSYGSHGNDMLWVEYGFLLERNKWDSVSIPADVVLGGLSSTERELVEAKGYLGGYTLRDEGVCWRTEVVAWVQELSEIQWKELANGLWFPEEEEDEDSVVEKGAGVEVLIYRDTPRRRVMRRIVTWVLEVKEEAENSLYGLTHLDDQDVEEIFEEYARQRLEMTVTRWKQIWKICKSALRSIELDCPGSFVVPGLSGRTSQDLRIDLRTYIDSIESDIHYVLKLSLLTYSVLRNAGGGRWCTAIVHLPLRTPPCSGSKRGNRQSSKAKHNNHQTGFMLLA